MKHYNAELLLQSNLFMSIGTLHIAGDTCESEQYHNYHEKELACAYDTIDGMLYSIAESTVHQLKCLKMSGTNPNPDALGKAVCKIPTVEIDEVIFRTSDDLEHFLNQIISCESLVLQSFTFNYGLFRSTKGTRVLNGIDQRLLSLVAVKMKYFKISVDVNLAEAILLSIGECKDIQLQDLELEVFTVTYGRMITQIISPHLLGYLNIYRNIKIFNYIRTNHNIQIERPNI